MSDAQVRAKKLGSELNRGWSKFFADNFGRPPRITPINQSATNLRGIDSTLEYLAGKNGRVIEY